MKTKITWPLVAVIAIVAIVVAALVVVPMLSINLGTKALILIGLTILALIGIAWLAFLYAKATNMNVTTFMDMIVNGIDTGEALAVALAPFAPGIPTTIIIKIADDVKKAVIQSEATYKAAMALPGETVDQRKVQATSLIQSNLTLEGITIDDKISKLISVAIDLMCRALPKTHVAVAPVTAAAQA